MKQESIYMNTYLRRYFTGHMPWRAIDEGKIFQGI